MGTAKAYIIMEHPDGIGGTGKDVSATIHAVFFGRRRAEDFVRGMVSYVNTYEDHRLFFVGGNAIDENDTIHFQIVEKAPL